MGYRTNSSSLPSLASCSPDDEFGHQALYSSYSSVVLPRQLHINANPVFLIPHRFISYLIPYVFDRAQKKNKSTQSP
jgi:hypothetical protein